MLVIIGCTYCKANKYFCYFHFMIAKDLISDVIPALKTSDTGLDALNWMEVFKVSHLPIVNNETLLGLISEADIYDQNRIDTAIGEHRLSLLVPYVYEFQHIYDVVEVASRLRLSVIPVVDDEKKYVGLISLSNLTWQFGKLIGSSTPGAVIEIEVKPRDYSIGTISRIIEDADAEVLSLYVSQEEQSQNYRVIVKVNKIDTTIIMRSFERFGHTIRVVSSYNDSVDHKLKENYDSLMKYLDV